MTTTSTVMMIILTPMTILEIGLKIIRGPAKEFSPALVRGSELLPSFYSVFTRAISIMRKKNLKCKMEHP
jgi:hypothetical protein